MPNGTQAIQAAGLDAGLSHHGCVGHRPQHHPVTVNVIPDAAHTDTAIGHDPFDQQAPANDGQPGIAV